MKKTREEYNAYMKEYMLKRYHTRRNLLLDSLGAKCSKCGSVDRNDLEVDHIDRTQKTFDVARLWSVNEKLFKSEIDKCQLLCSTCHKSKTLVDMGLQDAKYTDTHGTLSTYRYCKCVLCRRANAEYNREWKLRSGYNKSK